MNDIVGPGRVLYWEEMTEEQHRQCGHFRSGKRPVSEGEINPYVLQRKQWLLAYMGPGRDPEYHLQEGESINDWVYRMWQIEDAKPKPSWFQRIINFFRRQ